MTLREFRGQVRLYALQHGDALPDAVSLSNVLLGRTDAAGNVGTTPEYKLGPYMMSFPVNPYNGRRDVKAVPAGVVVSPDNSTGWLYQVDGLNFTFVANSTGTDQAGKLIASY
jgi:hypothetical protein